MRSRLVVPLTLALFTIVGLAGCGSDENNTSTFLPFDSTTRRFQVVSNANGSVVNYYTLDGASIPVASLGQTVKSDLAIYGMSRYDVIDSAGQNFVAGAPTSGRYIVEVHSAGNNVVFDILDTLQSNANVATVVATRGSTTRNSVYAELGSIPSTAARWAAADSVATVVSAAGP